jgi:hypothetical protein
VSAIDEKDQQPQINAKYPWHRCLRQLMRLLMLLAVAVQILKLRFDFMACNTKYNSIQAKHGITK